MEFDRRFLLLCAGEVLVVAVGDLIAALVIQVLALAAFLDDRRGYHIFIAAAAFYALIVWIIGHALFSFVALGIALICGYAALSLYDYRLTVRAGGSA